MRSLHRACLTSSTNTRTHSLLSSLTSILPSLKSVTPIRLLPMTSWTAASRFSCLFVEGYSILAYIYNSFARDNHYEFSSLRRAKYSSMMLLYQLHTSDGGESAYSCNKCEKAMGGFELRFHCKTCTDFDLCPGCKETHGHDHEMDQYGFIDSTNSDTSGAAPGSSQDDIRRMQRAMLMKAFVHACNCIDPICADPQCGKMKQYVIHTRSCPSRGQSSCHMCKQVVYLCCYHAKSCTLGRDCRVPYCNNIRDRFNKQQQQQQAQSRVLQMRRMAMMQSLNTSQVPQPLPSLLPSSMGASMSGSMSASMGGSMSASMAQTPTESAPISPGTLSKTIQMPVPSYSPQGYGPNGAQPQRQSNSSQYTNIVNTYKVWQRSLKAIDDEAAISGGLTEEKLAAKESLLKKLDKLQPYYDAIMKKLVEKQIPISSLSSMSPIPSNPTHATPGTLVQPLPQLQQASPAQPPFNPTAQPLLPPVPPAQPQLAPPKTASLPSSMPASITTDTIKRYEAFKLRVRTLPSDQQAIEFKNLSPEDRNNFSYLRQYHIRIQQQQQQQQHQQQQLPVANQPGPVATQSVLHPQVAGSEGTPMSQQYTPPQALSQPMMPPSVNMV